MKRKKKEVNNAFYGIFIRIVEFINKLYKNHFDFSRPFVQLKISHTLANDIFSLIHSLDKDTNIAEKLCIHCVAAAAANDDDAVCALIRWVYISLDLLRAKAKLICSVYVIFA